MSDFLSIRFHAGDYFSKCWSLEALIGNHSTILRTTENANAFEMQEAAGRCVIENERFQTPTLRKGITYLHGIVLLITCLGWIFIKQTLCR